MVNAECWSSTQAKQVCGVVVVGGEANMLRKDLSLGRTLTIDEGPKSNGAAIDALESRLRSLQGS